MNIKHRQALSVILAVVGGLGVALTAYLTRKAAKKEVDILKESGEDDVKVVNKKVRSLYILPVTVGAATIASIVGSTLTHSAGVVASGGAAALLMQQGLKHGKQKIFSQKNEILEDVKGFFNKDTDTRTLYFDETVGWFKADPVKLLAAYSNFNQKLLVLSPYESGYEPWGTIGDFLKASEAELMAKMNSDFDIHPNLQLGWNATDLGLIYGYVWLYMTLEKTQMNDGTPYTIISWDCPPYERDETFESTLSKNPSTGYKPIFVKKAE